MTRESGTQMRWWARLTPVCPGHLLEGDESEIDLALGTSTKSIVVCVQQNTTRLHVVEIGAELLFRAHPRLIGEHRQIRQSNGLALGSQHICQQRRNRMPFFHDSAPEPQACWFVEANGHLREHGLLEHHGQYNTATPKK